MLVVYMYIHVTLPYTSDSSDFTVRVDPFRPFLSWNEVVTISDGEYSNQGSEGGRPQAAMGLEQSLDSYTAQGYNPEDPHLRLGQVCELGSD